MTLAKVQEQDWDDACKSTGTRSCISHVQLAMPVTEPHLKTHEPRPGSTLNLQVSLHQRLAACNNVEFFPMPLTECTMANYHRAAPSQT